MPFSAIDEIKSVPAISGQQYLRSIFLRDLFIKKMGSAKSSNCRICSETASVKSCFRRSADDGLLRNSCPGILCQDRFGLKKDCCRRLMNSASGSFHSVLWARDFSREKSTRRRCSISPISATSYLALCWDSAGTS